MRKRVSRRLLSLLLTLLMVTSLLPMTALADEGATVDPSAGSANTEQTADVEPDMDNGQAEEEDYIDPASDTEATTGSDEIAYVNKEKSVPLDESTFYRSVHLDCGRKYFSVSEIKTIIDYAAEYNYTHVELAFGNDGLRFLLDDMSIAANGTTYESAAVTAAIQAGNDAYDKSANNASAANTTEELTQSDMGTIISYATSKGIGIVPMFDAPGHLYAVIEAMETLGLTVASSVASTSGSSQNQAVNPTDAASINFVQALMQKYVTYFADQGCNMFNIAADECGFSSMDNSTYTAYAKLVNSMAAMVQNAGMTALAFSDGIDYVGKSLEDGVGFDTNIAICYWTAGTNYASAASLAQRFKIINTNASWYYVIGKETTTGNDWSDYAYHQDYAVKNMSASGSCLQVDGDSNGAVNPSGCMAAIWCDNPSASVNWSNVKAYIAALQTGNPDYFKADSEPDTVDPTPKASDEATPTTSKTISMVPGEIATDTIDGTNYADGTTYSTDDSSIATVTVTGTEYVDPTLGSKLTSISSGLTGVISDGNGHFLVIDDQGNVSSTDSFASATVFTVGGSSGSYTLQGNGKYLVVNSSGSVFRPTYSLGTSETSTTWNYNSSNGFYYKSSFTSRYLQYSDGWTVSSSSASTGALYSVTEEVPASTTVSFTGVAVGTTTCTVGSVVYTISVADADLTAVDALPVQTWLTNSLVRFSGDYTTKAGKFYRYTTRTDAEEEAKYAYYLQIPATSEGVYSQEGVSLSSLFPEVQGVKAYAGTYYSPKAQKEISTDLADSQEYDLVPFKGMLHTGTAQQVWGDDLSNDTDCTSFYYIRYWGKRWQASEDRETWTDIDTSDLGKTTGSYSSTGTQIVVYYMMRTEITDEVKTDVADWGYRENDEAYASQVTDNSYVMLDFAVKYEDNTQNPDRFPQKDGTFLFHCNSDSSGVVTSGSTRYRQLNNFRGVNQGDYEIYMITVTMTSDDSSTTLDGNETSYTYDGTEQIVWAIDEETRANSSLADYTSISGSSSVYSGCKIGGDPYIRGVEIYNQHGALITYYVRAIKTTDTLTVNYYEEGATNPFYSYDIAVRENTTFDPNFGLDENGTLVNNTVTNSLGVVQTVQSDLKQMPAIPAQYRYMTYNLVSAGKTEDLKTANLYYTFDSTKTFVVDYGLPLTIRPQDVNKSLADGSVAINSVTLNYSNSYATVTSDDAHNIIYTLKEMLTGSDTFKVRYSGTLTTETGSQDGSTADYAISVIPATSVYYEDSFGSSTFTFNSGTGADGSSIDWGTEGTTSTASQALDELGSKSANVYGYDAAYANNTTYSMGSAHKVSVSKNMAGDSVAWPTAEFTFKGTGFDIISQTDNNSGAIYVDVVRTSDNVTVKQLVVNNYYGYTYTDGKWTPAAGTGDSNALYQVPVLKVSGLDYGEYKVIIKVGYSSFQDKTGDSEYSFWLDAVRVYDPAGTNLNDEYAKDGEATPTYLELREILASTSELASLENTDDSTSRAVFIDGKDSTGVTVDDYRNYGPNHEVYLAKNQAIAFKVKNAAYYEDIQLGIKSVGNNAVSYTIAANDGTTTSTSEAITVNTATDMYYSIKKYAGNDQVVTITNTSDTDAILSITNLKLVPGTTPDASDTQSSPADVNPLSLSYDDALMAVSLVDAVINPVVEVETTFEPERFEASWSSNVKKGKTATLTVKTSEEVEAIQVGGQTINTYKTRTQRSGFGRKAQTTTYREFTYSITAQESGDYSVIAVNADGAQSEAITVSLTVKENTNVFSSMWNWFKGLF